MKKIKTVISMRPHIVNVCARIILLCGLIFSIPSCVEIAIDPSDDAGTVVARGKDGNLNFTFNFNDYGEGDGISLRNAGDLAPETVVVSVHSDSPYDLQSLIK